METQLPLEIINTTRLRAYINNIAKFAGNPAMSRKNLDSLQRFCMGLESFDSFSQEDLQFLMIAAWQHHPELFNQLLASDKFGVDTALQLTLQLMEEERPQHRMGELDRFVADLMPRLSRAKKIKFCEQSLQMGVILPNTLDNDSSLKFSVHFEYFLTQKGYLSEAEKDALLEIIEEDLDQINDVALFKKTPLQQVISQLQNAGSPENEDVLFSLAMTLIERGASLNLDVIQKSILIRHVISRDPEMLRSLIESGLLSPNFKIDGFKRMDLFLQENGVPVEIIAFVAKAQDEEDLIDKKRRKILQRPLTMSTSYMAREDTDAMRAEMVDGATTKAANASFSSARLKSREVAFLEKRSQVLETKFGSDMLLATGGGEDFTVKREVVIVNPDGSIKGGIKWDKRIRTEISQRYCLPDESLLDDDSLVKYAKLSGAIQVFGEGDTNDRNVRFSEKTGKFVKIDQGVLFNTEYWFRREYGGAYQAPKEKGLAPNARLPIYGSSFSFMLLHSRFAGEDAKECYDLQTEALDQLEIDITYLQGLATADEMADFANRQIAIFNAGINDDLLEKIKTNIADDSQLQREFLAFMAGVQKSINLAEDQKFLDEYVDKYEDEIGEDARQIAKQGRRFLEENAACAKEQFASYFVYAKQLATTRFLEAMHSKNEDAKLEAIVCLREQGCDPFAIAIEAKDDIAIAYLLKREALKAQIDAQDLIMVSLTIDNPLSAEYFLQKEAAEAEMTMSNFLADVEEDTGLSILQIIIANNSVKILEHFVEKGYLDPEKIDQYLEGINVDECQCQDCVDLLRRFANDFMQQQSAEEDSQSSDLDLDEMEFDDGSQHVHSDDSALGSSSESDSERSIDSARSSPVVFKKPEPKISQLRAPHSHTKVREFSRTSEPAVTLPAPISVGGR